MQFNHNFTSKLESRGQSTTLDKHWPSILSQLSVSVDPGGKKVVVDVKVLKEYHVEQILSREVLGLYEWCQYVYVQ